MIGSDVPNKAPRINVGRRLLRNGRGASFDFMSSEGFCRSFRQIVERLLSCSLKDGIHMACALKIDKEPQQLGLNPVRSLKNCTRDQTFPRIGGEFKLLSIFPHYWHIIS